MVRRVEPEWLDTLPPHDPRARRSRADLVRVNGLMGNAGRVAAALRKVRPRTVAEIGGGSGRFLLAVARRARVDAPIATTRLDREPCVDTRTLARLETLGWSTRVQRRDVFEWLADPATPVFDVIVANLFLHHFDDASLARLLGAVASRARFFIACEPRRSRLALAGAGLLGLIGCNDVTRHDAVVSVRAGFRDDEISRLWRTPGWHTQEGRAGPFAHSFIASPP
jgi:SAM-dependent methyltransferase